MSNNANKRKTVFIKKAFQGRFILNVFLVILLSGICSAVIIYWFTGSDLQAQTQTAHENVTNALDHLGISIFIGNMVAMLIAGTITIFMVLYSSHKIAGPLYRFEKLCEHIGDGQLDTITKLREGDQLQDLGTAFSDMVIKLRIRKKQREDMVAKLTSHFEELQHDPAVTSNHTELLDKISQALEQLKD